MTSALKQLLEAANAHPFLFVGSGFTHRYLKTDDWKGLIEHFAKQAKPDTEFALQFYRNEVEPDSSGGIDLPAITEHIAKDYNRRVLSDPEFKELRASYADQIHAGVSTLKIGVSDLFYSQEENFENADHPEEISALGHARKNIAGIITTNFDRYLEHLFPDHVPYIGQDELLFNQSYGVGEIYKIHGCVSAPSSLVLTKADYASYKNRNAYLSAKLMTIFLEHPIIFIGYSLTDSNIRLIFEDIANCLNESQLSKLSERLIFIQRAKEGRPAGISTVRENFDNKSIEFKQVVLPEFSTLFKSIAALRSSYPPKILRKLKKDIYDMVLSTEPKERISVIDIDENTDLDTVTYVMGVGVSKQLSGTGYGGLDVRDLIQDVIYDDRAFEAELIVGIVLPKLGRQTTNNLPMFKYLSQAEDLILDTRVSKYVDEVSAKGVDTWLSKSIHKQLDNTTVASSIEELRAKHDITDPKCAHTALVELAYISTGQIDLDGFRGLLIQVDELYSPMQGKPTTCITTDFRRAVRIYDWLKYWHKKTPKVPKGTEAD
jgi:hypothetical protein